MRKIPAIILIFAVIVVALSAGCATQSVHQSKENTLTAITATQSPETTFISPTGSGKTISPATAQTSTQIPRITDPIIGTWTLENAPYTGTAIFFDGGSGSITVGLTLASATRQFAWSFISEDSTNQTRTYHISLNNGNTVTDGIMYSNGTIYSDALPEGSYLKWYR